MRRGQIVDRGQVIDRVDFGGQSRSERPRPGPSCGRVMSPSTISVRSRPAGMASRAASAAARIGRDDEQAHGGSRLGQKAPQQLPRDKARIAGDENALATCQLPSLVQALLNRLATQAAHSVCANHFAPRRRRQIFVEPVGQQHHVVRHIRPAVRGSLS